MLWLSALILLMTMLPTTALAAAAPGTSSGTVIYVSESGDDSAAGDESAPLKTIGAAFMKAADFILGYSVSGPQTWKSKDGRTLKEIETRLIN